ncbi:hypothetical protein EVAR_67256_1 [Eumeta japonica]|uniref:Uncharacterized protein n=1 Tax=Eumeta variegata TaxID=151549 RepID=A0A4C1YUC0_EUMVA|nr:hypothetical protein EVAR_67256_1 [Eumeta japonica]
MSNKDTPRSGFSASWLVFSGSCRVGARAGRTRAAGTHLLHVIFGRALRARGGPESFSLFTIFRVQYIWEDRSTPWSARAAGPLRERLRPVTAGRRDEGEPRALIAAVVNKSSGY